MRPIMKWAERWIRAVLGGCGRGWGGVWKGQRFSQRKAATLNLFDASPPWFQSHRHHSGVYQEGRLMWRCLLRPTRSCITCERSVLPARFRRQRQEHGLMRVRTVITLMHPKSDEICRRHTHSGKQNPWEAISDSASHSGYKGLRLSSLLTSTAVHTSSGPT